MHVPFASIVPQEALAATVGSLEVIEVICKDAVPQFVTVMFTARVVSAVTAPKSILEGERHTPGAEVDRSIRETKPCCGELCGLAGGGNIGSTLPDVVGKSVATVYPATER